MGLLPLLQALYDAGYGSDELFRLWGIDLNALSENACLSQQQELEMIATAQAIISDPLLALRVGAAVNLPSYGSYAMLMLSAPDVATACQLGLQFQQLTYGFLKQSVSFNETHVVLRFHHPDLPLPIRHFVVDREMAGVRSFILEMVRGSEHFIRIGLARPRPDESLLQPYSRYLGERVNYDQSHSWISLPKLFLSQQMPHANSLAHRIYLRKCKAELKKRQPGNMSISQQIQQQLTWFDGQQPSIREMAQMVQLSERTLRRRLAEAGTSYRQLLDLHRQQRALQLVCDEQLSVNQAAEKLGYCDSTSFLKAFRRWTGTTPGMLQRQKSHSHQQPLEQARLSS